MSFNLTNRDPAALSKAIGAAIQDKRGKEEVSVAFGYGDGSPQKYPGNRMAGDALGIYGDFGKGVNDPSNRDVQDYMSNFMQQYMNSPLNNDLFGTPGGEV